MSYGPPTLVHNINPYSPLMTLNYVPVLHNYGRNAVPTIQPASYSLSRFTKGFRYPNKNYYPSIGLYYNYLYN